MKKLSFLIAILLCAQFCFAQALKNSLATEHLKGRVKKVELCSFKGNPADGKIDTLAPHGKFVELFDEQGNNTEDSDFDKDGLLTSKFIKRYNGKGEETEENYYRKNVLESTTFFKYDERANLVESDIKYITDNMSDKVLYKYDDKDNAVEDNVYKNDGSLRYKDIYKYDNKGNRTETDYFHANEDTVRVKWIFNCNDAGVEVQQRRYMPNGTLDAENNFTFENVDGFGNWQKKTSASNGHNRQGAKISSYSVIVRKIYYY